MAQMGGSIRRRHQLAQRFNPTYSGIYRKMLSMQWLIAGQKGKTDSWEKHYQILKNIFRAQVRWLNLNIHFVFTKSLLDIKFNWKEHWLMCRNVSMAHYIRLYPCWLSRIDKYSITVRRSGYIEPGAVRGCTWSWSSVRVPKARNYSSVWDNSFHLVVLWFGRALYRSETAPGTLLSYWMEAKR